jgi:hypothetical protein
VINIINIVIKKAEDWVEEKQSVTRSRGLIQILERLKHKLIKFLCLVAKHVKKTILIIIPNIEQFLEILCCQGLFCSIL